MAFITVGGFAPADFGARFVAQNATLAGRVRLAKGCSVWFGAVLRADTAALLLGEDSNVQDNAVLHTGPGLNVTVGARVTIGHSAVVHGCTVGDDVLIGMHATVMNGAVLGAGSIVAAGALIPEGMQVPENSLVMGMPAKVHGPVTEALRAMARENVEEYNRLAEKYAAAR